MPDLGPVFGALMEVFGPVIGAALKALMKTVLGMMLLGALATGTTVYFAGQGSWVRGLLAAALSLAALAVCTFLLAVKNAVMRGLLHGLQKLSLGRRVLELVFRQLGVTENSTQGERAGAAGRLVEKLPLREAEARLSGAVKSLLDERAAKTGVRAWLSRQLIEGALTRIEKITLARFRSEDAKTGGVDLLVVRDELAAGIDQTLTRGIKAQLNKLNLLVAGLYVAFAVLIAAVLPRLISS
jgi:hypothetical protein